MVCIALRAWASRATPAGCVSDSVARSTPSGRRGRWLLSAQRASGAAASTMSTSTSQRASTWSAGGLRTQVTSCDCCCATCTESVVRWVAPRRSVTLAIDAAAKLWTQRIRHFDRKRGESGGSGPSRGIDTLSFTLGTLMMRQIGLALSFFAVQALQARDFASTVFYVSGPEVIGEGEHKLHARVLSLLGSCPAESHLIIGNDADLIVQACAAAAVVEERQAALPPRSRLLPGGGAAPNGTDSFDQLTLLLTCGSPNPVIPVLRSFLNRSFTICC